MKNRYIIPVFVPHRGCPNKCTFCNQRRISGEIKDITGGDVNKIISEYLESNRQLKKEDIEVAFYGGSFTGIEKEKQIELLSVAKKYIDESKIDSIRLSTRPDYISQDILDYLKEYGVKTIELGVQSLNDKVLEESKRGHSAKVVFEASELIKKNNFVLGLQMMVGLKDSTEEIELETAKKIIEIHPDIVRIYPVLVIKDTELEDQYREGIYEPRGVDEAVDISAKLLQMFEKNNIIVIRIGLQTTDNINEGKDVVAGPFHPAFGELVKQRIIRNEIEEYIVKEKINNMKVNVICDNKDISKVVGNKRENIKYFKEKYLIDIVINSKNKLDKNYIVKEIY